MHLRLSVDHPFERQQHPRIDATVVHLRAVIMPLRQIGYFQRAAPGLLPPRVTRAG